MRVADGERTAANNRLRFYTVYDISTTIPDGSTLTDEMKKIYDATERMYAASSSSTLPFSATYPDSVTHCWRERTCGILRIGRRARQHALHNNGKRNVTNHQCSTLWNFEKHLYYIVVT